MKYLVLLFLILLSTIVFSSVPGQISTCQTLDTPGTYYLIADIITNVNCYPITTDGIIFDGNSHLIDGNFKNIYAFEMDSIGTPQKNNITIKNLTIKNFNGAAIIFEDLNSFDFNSNSLTNNLFDIIGFNSAGWGIDYNFIHNDFVSNSTASESIQIENLTDLNFYDNNFFGYQGTLIDIAFGTTLNISNNIIDGNNNPIGGSIFYLNDVLDTNITSNDINTSGFSNCIDLTNGSLVLISDNNCKGSSTGADGFLINGNSANLALTNNNIAQIFLTALYISGGTSITVSQNTFNSNYQDIEADNTEVSIQDNNFIGNTGTMFSGISNGCIEYTHQTNGKILRNTFYGTYKYDCLEPDEDIEIQDNNFFVEILDDFSGILFMAFPGLTQTNYIKNNVFYKNTASQNSLWVLDPNFMGKSTFENEYSKVTFTYYNPFYMYDPPWWEGFEEYFGYCPKPNIFTYLDYFSCLNLDYNAVGYYPNGHYTSIDNNAPAEITIKNIYAWNPVALKKTYYAWSENPLDNHDWNILKTSPVMCTTCSRPTRDGNGYTFTATGFSEYSIGDSNFRIFRPKDETTNMPIDGNWSIQISGDLGRLITGISQDYYDINWYNINPTNEYYVKISSDVNNPSYYSRTYSISAPQGLLYYELQPYLIKTSLGILVTLKTQTLNEKEPIPRMNIGIFRTFDSNSTKIAALTTDMAGETTTYLELGQTYILTFDINGTVFQTHTSNKLTIVGTTNTYYFYFSGEGLPWIGIPDLNIPIVIFNPQSNTVPTGTTNLSQQIFGSRANHVTITYYQYADSNMLSGKTAIKTTSQACANGCIVTQAIAGLVFNTNKVLFVDVNVYYDNNAYFVVYRQSYFYQTGPNIITALMDMRRTFGCSTNQAEPCGASMIASVIITIMLLGGIVFKFGFASPTGLGIIGLLILGGFTYIGWVWWVMYAIIVILTILGFYSSQAVTS